MSISLCNRCFPPEKWAGFVYTSPPILPCAHCGAMDGHDYRFVRSYPDDVKPLLQAEELQHDCH